MKTVGRLVAVLLLVLVSTGQISADDRNLVKYHQQILFDEELLGEYTLIVTLDQQQPMIHKYLYEDQAGERLVLMWQLADDAPNLIEVTSVSSGETLSIVQNMDNSSTIVLGDSDPIVLLESDAKGKLELSTDLTDDATTALAGVSVQFRGALKRLARVGANHTENFQFVSAYLGGLFFTEYTGKLSGVERAGPTTELIQGFDPQVHEPGEFEQGFGDAYYQFP